MELLQLNYFCRAAEDESFARAAEHFKVPQSNVSRAVRAIEKELGVKLFSRTANRISLNERGKSFFRYAKESLDTLEKAKRAACDYDGEPRGEIKLLLGTCRRLAMAAIERTVKLYPDVKFSVRHGAGGTDFDLAVSDIPPSKKKYDRVLLTTERMLLAAPDSLGEASIEKIRDCTFISLGRGTRLHALTEQYCQSLGFNPTVSIQTDDTAYVRKYLEMGLGVALWPEKSWAGNLPCGVSLKDIGFPKRESFVFFESGADITSAKKIFIDILKEEFEKA